MLLPVIALLVGLILLIWSADRFVEGASAVATHLGVSPLVIGMVIIGFGTSAPELIVSTVAALDDNPGLALGNAYGSNIANIGLVIGLAALLAPMKIASGIVRK
ncbi:MAG: calcium/sodium antiporter, partial [Natronospirillum sp.]